MRGETRADFRQSAGATISIHSPHARGDRRSSASPGRSLVFQSTPLMRGETQSRSKTCPSRTYFNPLPSCEGRPRALCAAHHAANFNPLPSHEGRRAKKSAFSRTLHFNPLPSHEGRRRRCRKWRLPAAISIHSPHTRGDSISLQKSVQIYVSLHNKTMIHRFSGLYKPLFAAQSPIFGVRNPRKSRDSFTFARPSAGRGITP